ncbi:MAG: PsbP-related protein, partial [Candidatus Nitrosopolaris sp.]
VATMQTVFAQQTTKSTTNFLQYANSTYGIKLQYPSSWDKEENGTKQDTETDVVTFSPPAINSNASLDISIDDISDEKGIALAQYASSGVSDLKQSLKNFKLVGLSTNSVLAGLPAYKSIYTYVDQNTIFKDMEIGAIKGDKVYILTYEAGMNEYDKYLPVIQELINSFQVTK